jgi:hypothetical protein
VKASSGIGVSRIYNTAFSERGRTDVIKWEAMPVTDGEVLTLHFESVDSPWRQGVWLRTDAGITVNGQRAPSMTIWQDIAPSIVPFTCHTSNGFLSFYNIWYSRRLATEVESLSHSSGMLAEEILGGFRYRCNDIGFNTQFQKLVFSIQRTTECA